LHYDKRLIYNNSISLSGTQLDIPGEQWQTRAKIRIPKSDLALDTVSGIAIFTVFPDGTDCFAVSIDSMNILSPTALCTYSIGGPDSATICAPQGCGIMPITNFMLHGTFPQLFIQPNPAQGETSITSSADLGPVSLAIYDMLGIKRSEQRILLLKNSPVKISLPESNGVYQILLETPKATYNLHVIRSR
jgi:hypothetical protein